ncbi:MAG: Hpt domain-containing protein [Bdellovibrionales bacterium]|nr:Hpt domain-containing protein [Bdellovibrionales bacterium]
MKELINQATLKKFVFYELCGEFEVIHRLKKLFFEQIHELIHIPVGEVAKIAKQAHKLKSSSYSFGTLQLIDILISTEIAAKNGDLKAVENLLGEVKKQLVLLEKELTHLIAQYLNKGA